MTPERVATEALSLPAQDRVNLAQALWQSLAHPIHDVDPDHLLETCLRRGRELDSGVVQGVSREEAMRHAREAL